MTDPQSAQPRDATGRFATHPSNQASELATRPADGYRAAVNDHCASVRRWVEAWRGQAAPFVPREAQVQVLVGTATALATGPVARQIPADLDTAWDAYRDEWDRQTHDPLRLITDWPHTTERLRGQVGERVRRG